MFMQQTNEHKSAVSDPIMMPVSESVDPSFVKYMQGLSPQSSLALVWVDKVSRLQQMWKKH